jgi:hypothetical protein
VEEQEPSAAASHKEELEGALEQRKKLNRAAKNCGDASMQREIASGSRMSQALQSWGEVEKTWKVKIPGHVV